MGAGLNAAGDLGVVDGHAQRLHGKAAARGAGGGAGRDGRLPAYVGHMGLVHHGGGLVGLVLERVGRAAGGGAALGHQLHLHGLCGLAVALGAGAGAVLCPAQPAVVGRVNAVPHVVLVRQLAGELYLHGLHGKAAPGGACGARGPALPAYVGDVGAGLNAALFLIAIDQAELQRLQWPTLTRCANGLSIV